MGHALVLGMACLLAACTAPRVNAPGEKLYFALEVRRGGKLVAQPKFLGEAGKPLRAHRASGAAPGYRLRLEPSRAGGSPDAPYRLSLDLELDGIQGRGELSLLHGEERKVELGGKPGDLEVSLLLMRVDTPEFRALMELADVRV